MLAMLKQLLMMTSIFVFLFFNEVVYPTDYDFIFYGIFTFLKMFFYPLFYESDCNQNKLFVYLNICLRTFECSYSIGQHVDAVGPALSRHSVLRGNPPDQPVPPAIKGGSY